MSWHSHSGDHELVQHVNRFGERYRVSVENAEGFTRSELGEIQEQADKYFDTKGVAEFLPFGAYKGENYLVDYEKKEIAGDACFELRVTKIGGAMARKAKQLDRLKPLGDLEAIYHVEGHGEDGAFVSEMYDNEQEALDRFDGSEWLDGEVVKEERGKFETLRFASRRKANVMKMVDERGDEWEVDIWGSHGATHIDITDSSGDLVESAGPFFDFDEAFEVTKDYGLKMARTAQEAGGECVLDTIDMLLDYKEEYPNAPYSELESEAYSIAQTWYDQNYLELDAETEERIVREVMDFLESEGVTASKTAQEAWEWQDAVADIANRYPGYQGDIRTSLSNGPEIAIESGWMDEKAVHALRGLLFDAESEMGFWGRRSGKKARRAVERTAKWEEAPTGPLGLGAPEYTLNFDGGSAFVEFDQGFWTATVAVEGEVVELGLDHGFGSATEAKGAAEAWLDRHGHAGDFVASKTADDSIYNGHRREFRDYVENFLGESWSDVDEWSCYTYAMFLEHIGKLASRQAGRSDDLLFEFWDYATANGLFSGDDEATYLRGANEAIKWALSTDRMASRTAGVFDELGSSWLTICSETSVDGELVDACVHVNPMSDSVLYKLKVDGQSWHDCNSASELDKIFKDVCELGSEAAAKAHGATRKSAALNWRQHSGEFASREAANGPSDFTFHEWEPFNGGEYHQLQVADDDMGYVAFFLEAEQEGSEFYWTVYNNVDGYVADDGYADTLELAEEQAEAAARDLIQREYVGGKMAKKAGIGEDKMDALRGWFSSDDLLEEIVRALNDEKLEELADWIAKNNDIVLGSKKALLGDDGLAMELAEQVKVLMDEYGEDVDTAISETKDWMETQIWPMVKNDINNGYVASRTASYAELKPLVPQFAQLAGIDQFKYCYIYDFLDWVDEVKNGIVSSRTAEWVKQPSGFGYDWYVLDLGDGDQAIVSPDGSEWGGTIMVDGKDIELESLGFEMRDEYDAQAAAETWLDENGYGNRYAAKQAWSLSFPNLADTSYVSEKFNPSTGADEGYEIGWSSIGAVDIEDAREFAQRILEMCDAPEKFASRTAANDEEFGRIVENAYLAMKDYLDDGEGDPNPENEVRILIESVADIIDANITAEEEGEIAEIVLSELRNEGLL